MDFDPSSATPVESDFDPSSAVPVEFSLAKQARESIDLYKQGKIKFDHDQLTELETIAANGTGPWDRLWSGVAGIVAHPIDTAKAIGGAVSSGLDVAKGAINELGDAAKDPASHTQIIPNIAAGVTKGLGALASIGMNIGTGIANLQDPAHANARNAIAASVERGTNLASQGVDEALGANPESPVSKVAEIIPQAMIPIGIEGKSASTVAKIADATVEKGTEIAGKAMVATGKVGKAVTMPATIATELATGHPIMAAFTAAGYRRLKHDIIDKAFDKVSEIGKTLSNLEYGQTYAEGLQESLTTEAGRLRAQIDDIVKRNTGKVEDAYKTTTDGQPLYKAEELSGPAKRVREAEDQISLLNQRNETIGHYSTLNQILSDGAKFGLRTGMNLGVAGATGAAIIGPSAPPGQEEETARQGFGMGVGFGLLGSYGASKRQKLGLVREKLLEGKTLSEDHPLYEAHQANMKAMPPQAQDYVNSFSALANKVGKKPIVVLNPDEMIAALKLEGTDVAAAPNGFEGKDVIYANSQALSSGVVPHEFTHGAGLDSHPDVISAIEEMQADPKTKERLESALAKYNKDLQNNLPGETLSADSQPKEIAAALGADMLTSLPPEAIYGGRSGSQIIGKWLKDAFGRDSSTTSQYGFPVTPKMKSAMENALFDLGKSAEKKLSDIEAPKTYPEDVTTAAQALEKLGHDKKKASQMAESAYDDIKTGNVEEIVRKALEKQVPKPIAGSVSSVNMGDTSSATKGAASPEAESRPAPQIPDQTLKSIHLGIEKGEITKPEDLSKFNLMPSRPEVIASPAIKAEDMIFTGSSHLEAKMKAKKFGLSDLKNVEEGFVTKKGEFLASPEARTRGEESGQLPESNKDILTPQDLASERRFMPSSARPEDYRGDHGAPDRESGAPLHSVSSNGIYPEDVYGDEGRRYYGTGEDAMDNMAHSYIQSYKNHPNRPVTVYRAVPKIVKGGINPGDWITPIRKYAVDHGKSSLGNDFKIQSKLVFARDVFTSGDSWLEWGYDPQPRDVMSDLARIARRRAKLNQENPKQLQEGPLDVHGRSPARSGLADVSLEGEAKKPNQNDSMDITGGPFTGKTIEAGEPPWSIRLKELSEKDWEGKLAPQEEAELTDLHKEAVKSYGSYAKWFEAQGGEKDYLSKVFGDEPQKNLMPSPDQYRAISEQYGLKYEGLQEGYKTIPAKHLFSDPAHGSTFSIPETASPEELLAKIKKVRERMNPQGKLSLMPSPNKLGFYSKLEDVLETKMGGKASPEQILGLIKNNGVKADELKWSGLDDYLKDKKSVSKQEVLDYLKENNVQVKEVTLGNSPVLSEKYGQLKDKYDKTVEEYRGLYNTSERKQPEHAAKMKEAEVTMYELREKMRVMESDAKDSASTKYSEHTLPGGDKGSYREVLLTLPKANSQFKGGHFDEPNVLAHVRYDTRTDSQGRKIMHLSEVQSDWHQLGRKQGYRQPGSGEKPFVVQSNGQELARFDTEQAAQDYADGYRRTSRDINVKVSHDEGASKAPDAPFKTSWPALALKRMVRLASEKGMDALTWDTGEIQAARYDLSKQVKEINIIPRTDARTGERTKSVEVVLHDGNFVQLGVDANNNIDNVSGTSDMHGAVVGKPLTDVVGKEVAEKIASTDTGTLSAEDLKVGGLGMKKFYDTMLPSIAKEIGKKFGAKVDEAMIPVHSNASVRGNDAGLKRVSREEALVAHAGGEKIYARHHSVGNYQELRHAPRDSDFILSMFPADQYSLYVKSPEHTVVHSLEITPAMRESAMMQGFPMFQPSGGAMPSKSGLANVRLTKYDTRLDKKDEEKFLTWKARHAPLDSGEDYDLRGAFKAGVKPDNNGHWPDTFKKPNHPTFSTESKYAKDRPELAGKWENGKYIPPTGKKKTLKSLADLPSLK